MQQDDFRRLLATPRPSSSTPTTGYTSIAQRKAAEASKTATAAGDKPAFKPRKTAKGKEKEAPESQWRDRAKERREGIDAAEDLAATLPVPKSGLDFAQLEADRLAREEAEQVDAEENLEAAFTAESPPEVKKKSREELLADLAVQHAAKRAEGDLAKSKFKRVGEKKAVPSTAVTADGKKLRKKKRKVEEAPKVEPVASTSKAPSPPPLPLSVAPVIAEDDDVDIFADAGEYKAFDDSDSGDDAVPKPPKPAITTAHPIATTLPANLFGDDDEEIKADPLSVPSLKPRKATPPEAYGSDEDDDRTGGKLRGFADGTDIQEILALDKAAEREEKRKERKEKRQAEALEHGGVLPVEPKKKKAKSDKDRMNEEWQEYENYVRKKGGVEAQE